MDCEEYKASLVSHTTKEITLVKFNFGTSTLFHALIN